MIITKLKRMFSLIVVIVLAFSIIPEVGVFATDIKGAYVYVSKNGNDSGDGSEAKPFATIEKAQKYVQSIIRRGTISGGITVCIGEGEYNFINKGLTFTRDDSGVKSSPVTYKAMGNVVFSGAVPLNSSDFKPTEENLNLPKEIADNIVKINLKDMGYSDFDGIPMDGQYADLGYSNSELFINNEPTLNGRFPNEGHIKATFSHNLGKEKETGPYTIGLESAYSEAMTDWVDVKYSWLQGRVSDINSDSTIRLSNISPERRILEIPIKPLAGLQQRRLWSDVAVLNVLQAVDVPGEWYLNYDTGELYLYKPQNFEKAKLCVSMLKTPIISMDGASYINFEGITFEANRAEAIHISRGKYNKFDNCIIRNNGSVGAFVGMGVKLTGLPQDKGDTSLETFATGNYIAALKTDPTLARLGGVGHEFVNCEIYNNGSGGLVIGGGDRLALKSCNIKVENNVIHDVNRRAASSRPAVAIDGVGSIVKNNLIYNVPSSAVTVTGNFNKIYNNEIVNCATRTAQGNIYVWGDITTAGNEIKNNYIAYGGEDSYGVYLDNFLCYQYIENNVFVGSNRKNGAVYINSGQFNTVSNNVIFNSSSAGKVYSKNMQDTYGWAGNLFSNSTKACFDKVRLFKIPYKLYFPKFDSIYKAPPINTNIFSHNVLVNTEDFDLDIEHSLLDIGVIGATFIGNVKVNSNINIKKSQVVFNEIINSVGQKTNINLDEIGCLNSKLKTKSTGYDDFNIDAIVLSSNNDKAYVNGKIINVTKPIVQNGEMMIAIEDVSKILPVLAQYDETSGFIRIRGIIDVQWRVDMQVGDRRYVDKNGNHENLNVPFEKDGKVFVHASAFEGLDQTISFADNITVISDNNMPYLVDRDKALIEQIILPKIK